MNNNIFYIDITDNSTVLISDLLAGIRSLATLPEICYSTNYADVFKHLVASLIFDKPVILLDSDMTQSEKNALVQSNQIWDINKNIAETLNLDNYIEHIQSPKKNWTITLFTSGTTGLPKKISHNFESITRNIRRLEKYSNNVWGFAYNPTHMAGVQVFFQAILNQNTIIRLFGLSKNQIFESIYKYRITHISATPTFYRLLLPVNVVLTSVIKLTSGGEKFDELTLKKLTQTFPSAKITNVYASTEAGSLLATTGDCFIIKPQHEHLFKIFNKELLIHQSLLGNSDTIKFEDKWYHTNDLVEIIDMNPTTFKIISRKNEMINIGGYKVNPFEIEDTLRQIACVKEAVVYAKTNRLLGNIICCDVILLSPNAISEAQLRKELTTKLQEFKIPRIINFVEDIKTTRTGKVSRI